MADRAGYNPPAPTELELAWAAGLIDGEGCFTVGRDGDRKRFRIFVVLQERDGFVCDRLLNLLGGTRRHRARQASWKPNCKEQEEWAVLGLPEALRVAYLLEPYLVLKAGTCRSFIAELEAYLKSPRRDGKRRNCVRGS